MSEAVNPENEIESTTEVTENTGLGDDTDSVRTLQLSVYSVVSSRVSGDVPIETIIQERSPA